MYLGVSAPTKELRDVDSETKGQRLANAKAKSRRVNSKN